jgi:hypothetical protein
MRKLGIHNAGSPATGTSSDALDEALPMPLVSAETE